MISLHLGRLKLLQNTIKKRVLLLHLHVKECHFTGLNRTPIRLYITTYGSTHGDQFICVQLICEGIKLIKLLIIVLL